MAVQTETGDVLEDELKVLQRSESIVKDVKLQLKMSYWTESKVYGGLM